jgi:hypothetical protein
LSREHSRPAGTSFELITIQLETDTRAVWKVVGFAKKFQKRDTQQIRQICLIFLDNRVLCGYVNGIFHPNGTPDFVKAGKKSERQSGRGMPGKLIWHARALR